MVVMIVGAVRRYGTAAKLTVWSLVAASRRHEMYAAVRVVIVLQQEREIKTFSFEKRENEMVVTNYVAYAINDLIII